MTQRDAMAEDLPDLERSAIPDVVVGIDPIWPAMVALLLGVDQPFASVAALSK